MEPTARGVPARAWLVYLLVGSAGAVGYYLLPRDGESALVLRVVLYCLVSASAAVAVGVGILRNRPRPALSWLLLGLSQVVYAAADAAFYISHFLLGHTAYPSTADVLYLGHYPLMMAGLVLLIRQRVTGRDLSGLLDALALGLVAALLTWVYLISPQVGGELSAAGAASVAYPTMDLLVLAVALRLVLGPGRRPGSFLLLCANLAAILTADTIYVAMQVNNVYTTGNFIDLIWLGGNLCLGAAALHPTMSRLGQPSHATDRGSRPGRIVLLSLAATVAPIVLLIEHVRGNTATVLPAATGACVLLFFVTWARLYGLIVDQRRLAITDGLTGLHTRRFLEAQLALEVARARRGGTRVGVFIVDVDNFKSINDHYGHAAGDRALIEIAHRLRGAIRTGDVLARYGGEEFALLVPGAELDDLALISERLRLRVASGPIAVSSSTSVLVTVSVGAVSYPRNGDSPEALVAAADRALYRAKARGRDRVVVGEPGLPTSGTEALMGDQAPMIDFLRHVADQVDALLSAHEHSSAISRWATLLSAKLGHDENTMWRLELAGRLHDIGKIVVCESILTKPGSLSEEEWALLRQHPDYGARLARLVPGFAGVADVIRQHHERFDGTGYPDRLQGTDIRLEARIIAVCDAWAAMRSDRSYQGALSEERARDELWTARGTQFDPDLVDLFLDLHEQGGVGRLELIRQRPPSDPPVDQAALSAKVFQKLIS